MSYRFTSADRLAQSNDAEVITTWDRIVADYLRQDREWVAKLRTQGIKAAHPDDGWVNRVENYVEFAYAGFDQSPQVGDKIALGWPWQYRIVTVTRVEPKRGIVAPDHFRYYFEEVQ